MEIVTFGSHEEMTDYLKRAKEAALAGLTPQQMALTWGSTWVQFHDVKRRHLVFGEVDTGQGITAEEALDTQSRLDEGLMYGQAWDRFNPGGEWGFTHKASAWPIGKDLFEAAREVAWDMDALSVEHQLELSLVWAERRAALTNAR